MDGLLIKVKLDPSCDKQLIEYFSLIPKSRRAEQARRLILDGLRINTSDQVQGSSVNVVSSM